MAFIEPMHHNKSNITQLKPERIAAETKWHTCSVLMCEDVPGSGDAVYYDLKVVTVFHVSNLLNVIIVVGFKINLL